MSHAEVLMPGRRRHDRARFLTFVDDRRGIRRTWSYAALADAAARLGDHLRSTVGVAGRFPVAISVGGGDVAVVACYACWHAGLEPVLVPEETAHPTWRSILTGVGAVIASDGARAAVAESRVPVLGVGPDLGTEWRRALAEADPDAPVADGSRSGLVVHTAGAVGRPKGVRIDAVGPASVTADRLGFDRQTRVVSGLPVDHAYGLITAVLAVHAAGGSVMLLDGVRSDTFWDHAAEQNADTVIVVPSMLGSLERGLDGAALTEEPRIICSGAPLDHRVAARWEAGTLVHGYGLTEAGWLVTLAEGGDRSSFAVPLRRYAASGNGR